MVIQPPGVLEAGVSVFVHFNHLLYSGHPQGLLFFASLSSLGTQAGPAHTPLGQGSQRSQSPATLVKREAGPDEPLGPWPQVRTTS